MFGGIIKIRKREGRATVEERSYIAIDLKSFYASVECVERGLDPMGVNLVVADESRTEKTICLAVTPTLKAYGISGRARLFEVVQRTREINRERKRHTSTGEFKGSSYIDSELKADKDLEIDYIVAKPRMAHYMKYSARIYEIYLKYVAPEDIHVYSVDEVFIDATNYLESYKMSARELAMTMILDVLTHTGITATAGVGPNLYLCKIAMDIWAKHIPADKNGVRIAELTEESYRRLLWNHTPITDFWRVGAGTARRLYENGMYTMGDIALCSMGQKGSFYSEELLYRLFGINAELLIDHAWGYESCTIADIKAYKPESSSICSGQVLQHPYTFDMARLVLFEMIDILSLELTEKRLTTDQIVLDIGYDTESLSAFNSSEIKGDSVKLDRYGRSVPRPAHSSENIGRHTSSSRLMSDAALRLYDRIADPSYLVRRINVTLNHVLPEEEAGEKKVYEQIDLFTDYEALERERKKEEEELSREKSLQKTLVSIKKKYGKNSVLKGMNLKKGATARERNSQVGGHKA